MKSRARILFGKFLIGVLALNCFVGFAPIATRVQAQNRVIVIKAEQPNVWTLEQAHYLLAQLHRRNLDLKAKSLEALDPNEISGLQFEVMRTLIEFGATFNQANLVANRLLAREQNFNAERRRTVIAQRDGLRAESLRLTREIARLETKKTEAETQEEKDRLTAEITAKTARRDKVDEQIEARDAELETLAAPSGEFKTTEADPEFDAEKLPKSVFDEAFEAAAKKQIEKFNEAPKLNASLRLENFLQMQYEIIAKQLTLLRDEVGPGERLLFLELPQTVNVAHHESNKKWAQSWWKLAGYTMRVKSEGAKKREEVSLIVRLLRMALSAFGINFPDDSSQPRDRRNQEPITTTQDLTSILNPTLNATLRRPVEYVSKFIDLDDNYPTAELNTYLGKDENKGKVKLSNRLVRTVDLIPRQSSLNINDIKLKVKSGAFSFVTSFLFGFGSRLNIQRQREQFSQFVQQELYSSAFGKGSREFGWTFTPMPGTDRLHSGVRTTYAVVVVPEEATSIVLESNDCYFPRSAYQPNDFEDTRDTNRWGDSRTSRGCGTKSIAFVVPIPSAGMSGSNDFWVEGVSYQPVSEGKRIVVLISGKNFSSQIGVLVNGVPLIHSIGLAQPLIRDDSDAGIATAEEFKNEEMQGRIERIDSNKIVFSFKMPDDFKGTPTITLIAPGRAVDINWLSNINVNEIGNTSLNNYAKKMFGHGPGPDAFRIDTVEVFRSAPGSNLTALINGGGYVNGQEIYINGNKHQVNPVSATLWHVVFPAPLDEKIQITIRKGNDTIKSQPIPNPAFLRISNVTVISYEAATDKKPGVLVVKIEGSGFPSRLVSSNPKKIRVDVTSSTEAFLTITNPNEAEVVTLTDPATNVSASTVVTRKPQKKE